jgi:hypothetical protein
MAVALEVSNRSCHAPIAGDNMLPYQTRVFDSALEVVQARARLRDAVEPEPRPRHAPTGRPFEGVLEGDTFRIRRIVRGRSSFRPELHGRIEATPTGRARAVVSFRLHPIVVAFMAVWLGIVFMLVLAASQEAVATGEMRFLRHTGAMFALGLLMPFIGFAIEARKAARFLEEVFGIRAS